VISMSDTAIPDWAYAAALAALPLQTHTRLRRLLANGDARTMWQMVIHSRHVDPRLPQRVTDSWSNVDRDLPVRMFDLCNEREISVVTHIEDEYPLMFRGDPTAPAVVFYKGSLSHLQLRRVAIIGTRHATRRGRHFASELAKQLSHHGVAVVSGLARGIDVAAHAGIRDNGLVGSPIAVVASGVDVIYPCEHTITRRWGSDNGLMISEAPPDTRPETHLFPLRHRIRRCIREILVGIE